MKSIEINGELSGDGECWCLNVTPEEYKRIFGEKEYQQELSYRLEFEQEFGRANKIPDISAIKWRIYPGEIFRVLGQTEGPVKFKIELI